MQSGIDDLGRIIIPIEIRHYLGIEEKDKMDIEVMGGSIVLTPAKTCCKICGCEEHLVEKGNHIICCYCLAEICG